MFRYVVFFFLSLVGGQLNAHQFLPTYPTFEQSFISGALQTKMQLFNRRQDVEYYELSVHDSDWNDITFASENKIIQVKYLETKNINVYIRKEDLKRVTYICTESRIKKQNVQITAISSRICSKVK
jgi:hypothetical protein